MEIECAYQHWKAVPCNSVGQQGDALFWNATSECFLINWLLIGYYGLSGAQPALNEKIDWQSWIFNNISVLVKDIKRKQFLKKLYFRVVCHRPKVELLNYNI